MISKQRHIINLVNCLFFCLLLSTSIYADQSQPNVAPLATQNNNPWILSLGLAPTIQPEYPGSNHSIFTYTALYNVSYNQRFFLNPQGLGVNILNREPLILGGAFVYAKPVARSKEFPGLTDFKGNIEANFFANYLLSAFTFNLSGYKALGYLGNQGFYTGSVMLTLPLTSKFILNLGTGVQYDDKNYIQALYGVTPLESLASGLPTYDVHSGWDNISYAIQPIYRINKRWDAIGLVQMLQYVEQVNASPVIQKNNTFTIEAGIVYNFLY